MDFRLPFKRVDDLPTYRNWGPMSTLRTFLGTFKRLDDLPTYRSGGALGVVWVPRMAIIVALDYTPNDKYQQVTIRLMTNINKLTHSATIRLVTNLNKLHILLLYV